MSNKNIDKLINQIKIKTNDNQEAIAKRVKYTRAHFSVMKKKNPDDLYDLIQEAYKEDLAKGQTLDIEGISPTVLALNASVKVLYTEVSILKGKHDKITPLEALRKMKEQASLILEGL